MAEKINTRRSFTEEFKLKVVLLFYDHEKNFNQEKLTVLKNHSEH